MSFLKSFFQIFKKKKEPDITKESTSRETSDSDHLETANNADASLKQPIQELKTSEQEKLTKTTVKSSEVSPRITAKVEPLNDFQKLIQWFCN